MRTRFLVTVCFLLFAQCGCSVKRVQMLERTDEPLSRTLQSPKAVIRSDAYQHRFAGYEEVLKFVARSEGLPQDEYSLFEIAADSELTRHRLPRIGELVVVRVDYRGHSQFGIRGAQGQGRYYAFQVTERTWRLVGVFQGNQLRWEQVDDTAQVIAHWHTSAFEEPSANTVFVWNGNHFESPTLLKRQR